MALLPIEQRQQYLSSLGYEYTKAGIKAFQKKYMKRKSDWDGIYGQNTDNTLRTVWNVKQYTRDFKPEEFACECGGKYCCGYPSYMKPVTLQDIQMIRTHWGRPVIVTCGMRCKTYNKKCNGSITNSRHLTGQAIDFYQKGVTDTLANRKYAIKYMKTLPSVNYIYGNGINSNGARVNAPYMGNALHIDTK